MIAAEDVAGPATQGGPLWPGRLFAGPADQPDRWELLGTGSTGGEGITWRARYAGRLASPLPCAVKMLHRPAGTGPDWPDEADLQRWNDQLVVLRHLGPARVVRLYSVTTGPPPHLPGARRGGDDNAANTPGVVDGSSVVYLEMEWLDGPTLDSLVRGEPASPATLADRLKFIEQVAEAVADLHSRSRTGGNPALHRDLKPGNCIVEPDRGLMLIDLSTLRLTSDGVDPLGRHTPAYTAPEVLSDPVGARDPRSDTFSLGALALFCLTGADPAPPSASASMRESARLARHVRAAGVRRSKAFAELLTAAVDPVPERRPVDVRVWARELATLAGPAEARVRRHHQPAGRRFRRRAVVPAAAAAIALLASGTGVLVANRPSSPDTSQATGAASGVVAAPADTAIGAPAGVATPSATPASAATRSAAFPGPRPSGAPAVSPTTRPTTTNPGATPARPVPSEHVTAVPVPGRIAGTIAVPAGGAKVPQCAYFSGTATIPAGKTLILVMQNVSNNTADRYVQYVFGWPTPPASPWSWRGAQYFGAVDDSIGQRYQVQLMSVDIDDAHRLGDSDGSLAAVGTPLASVEVIRVTGLGPNGCVGP